MKSRFKILLSVLVIIAVIGAGIYVHKNLTFSFVVLFLAMMILIAVPFFINERKTESNGEKGRLKSGLSLLYAFFILIFGGLTFFVLKNYFNAPPEVYKNYQHHALRLDGVKVMSEPFTLAANRPDAFLDNKTINGQIQIVGHSLDSIDLVLQGVTQPLYRIVRDKNGKIVHECLNEASLVSFQASSSESDPWIRLVSSELDEQGSPKDLYFKIIEGHKKKSVLKPSQDTLRCLFKDSPSSTPIESSFHQFIVSSYSLEGMATDVVAPFDLKGINIVRGVCNVQDKRSQIYKKYVKAHRPYCIEIQSDANLAFIQIGDGPMISVEDLKNRTIPVRASYKYKYKKNYRNIEGLFLGSGTNKTEPVNFRIHKPDSSLLLAFSLPKYQYLSSFEDVDESTVMVTSSILDPDQRPGNDSGLLENLTDNVLLFEIFHHTDNHFHLTPFFLSFKSGPTSEKMSFSVAASDASRVQEVDAGTFMTGIRSRNGTEWVSQVEDFRNTTNFGSTKLCWLLWIITLLCAFSLLMSEFGQVPLWTPFEYVVYLLIIGFIAVRFFLLWRISVFPPVSSVSKFEFGHFRSKQWLDIVWISFAVFIVVISLIKVYAFTRQKARQKSGRKNIAQSIDGRIRGFSKDVTDFRKKKWLWWLVWVVALLVIYLILFILGKSPSAAVILPPVVYLGLDALIYGFVGLSYEEDRFWNSDKKKKSNKEAVGRRADAFVLSIANLMLACLVTLLNDGGYGVMFVMFASFSFFIKIADVLQYTRYGISRDGKQKSRLRFGLSLLALTVLMGLLLLFLLRFKAIFIGLCDSVLAGKAWKFFFNAGWIILVVVGLVFVILQIKPRLVHLFLPLLIVAGCCLGTVLAPNLKGSHMEYRTRVLTETAGEIMFKVDSPSAQRKFQQASLNDWILHEYMNVGKDVKGFGEGGKGYFKMQPQSKIGAMWFAQTTDICLARYVIAENGALLPWLFVLAYALLLLISFRTPGNVRWARMVMIQVAILFAVQSLMILLANTRAFIFFGQDFPLVSLTSRVSSMYFFALMAIGVASGLIGKTRYVETFRSLSDRNMSERITMRSNLVGGYMCAFFVLSAFVLYFGGRSHMNEGVGEKGKDNVAIKGKKGNDLDMSSIAFYKERTYDLDSLVQHVSGELDRFVNPCLVNYQKTHEVPPLERNMTGFVDAFFRDSTFMDVKDNQCSQFTRRMLDDYQKRGAKNNSANNIICLRNFRRYEPIDRQGRTVIVTHDTLKFVTGLNSLKFELPQKVKKSWKGSIVEESKVSLPNDAYLDNSHAGYASAYIPGRFTESGEPVQLVRSRGSSPMLLIGSESIISLDQNDISVANVKKTDYLLANSRTITDLPLRTSRCFARNLLLNGKQTFIYPYGQKMFWAREIAAVNRRKQSAESGDVAITIDPKLAEDLYNCFSEMKGAGDRSVIVADGSGRILAMADYRADERFRLNPNDFVKVGQVSDSLYLNREAGWSTETRYFGNFARIILRCGPGSSQKPILWTAVTTVYNTGWWNTLSLHGIRGLENRYGKNSNSDGTYYLFKSYAGEPIETTFRSRKTDEGNGDPVSISQYMSASSNYYNSMMAYIGSFRKSDFQSGLGNVASSKDGSSLFYKVSVPDEPVRRSGQSAAEYNAQLREYASSYNLLFPLMVLDGETVAFNRFLDVGRLRDTLALAPSGLKRNFGLGYRYSQAEQSFPTFHFNMAVRENRTSSRQLNEYMVRSVAIGSNTVWSVSPEKMAEMYGRLVSLNSNYALSIYPVPSSQWEQFYLDESWSNGLDSYKAVRNSLLVGMSHVFSGGTANEIGHRFESREFRIDEAADGTAGSNNGFYIYGKTGTIDGIWGGEKDEDHLLATVITDRPLTQCTSEDLKKLKFIVIYQVDYQFKKKDSEGKYTRWPTAEKNIIEKVVSSDAFKDYFGIE